MQIDMLEQKEQELIKRLKITQNNHQMAVSDLERINRNQEPISILVETKNEWEKRTPKRKTYRKSATPSTIKNK